MARKTAIRITNAELGAEEYRREVARDVHVEGPRLSTYQLLRQAREMMTESELLALAKSAARLELRGAEWSAEDRADCASETVWHILTDCDGSAPPRGSMKGSLTHACHVAKNWRTSKLRQRAADKRAQEAAEDRLSVSGSAMWEALEMADIPDGYAAARQAQVIEEAHRVAEDATQRLELTTGGPVHAVFYQWARDESAAVCADENGVSAEAWQKRVERGQALIRAAFPSFGDLLDAIRDSEPITLYRRGRIDWPTREGTDGGTWPQRPEDATEAREACTMRHRCPVPGLAAMNASRARRGYLVRAPMAQGWSPESRAPRGYLWVEGKTSQQAKADALRSLARTRALESRRERGVSYDGERGGWNPAEHGQNATAEA